jgi:uncharacterized membrane protein
VLRLLQADAAISARNGVRRLAKLVCKMKAARFVVAILAVAPACFVMGQTNGARCIAAHKVVALPLRPADVNEARQVAGTTIGHRAALWTEQSGLRTAAARGFLQLRSHCSKHFWSRHRSCLRSRLQRASSFYLANNALTLLPGEQSHPHTISDSDEVGGESLLPGKTTTEPVLWIGNTIRLLGGCCGGSAKGVNNDGEAIGDVYDENGRYQAFLWTASRGLRSIGPPDRYSSAIAINAQGQVVVQAFSELFSPQAEGSLTWTYPRDIQASLVRSTTATSSSDRSGRLPTRSGPSSGTNQADSVT